MAALSSISGIVNTGIYVVMGVSGSGKSLIGSMLARALGIDFLEGDDFHSTENIERMASGIPLTDVDRAGWLHALSRRIRESSNARAGLVISCSALKRSYRDILRSEADNVQTIFLRGPSNLIAERIASRGEEHFMPLSLLDSQLATLEEPSEDEGAWVYDVTDPPDNIVADIVARAAT
jgi:gluconokinase